MLDTTGKRSFLVVIVAGVILLLSTGCKQKDLEPTPPEPTRPAAIQRPAPQFRPVAGTAESVQEAELTTLSLPQLHSRLVIRTLLVRAGKPVTLPIQQESILELRAGSLATVVENNRQERHRGEIWQVAKGDRVVLQASGELAVVRAVYLVSGQR